MGDGVFAGSKSNYKLPLGMFAGLLCMGAAFFWGRQQNLIEAHNYVCEMVAERSLFGNLEVGPWQDGCEKSARHITMSTTKGEVIKVLQKELSKVGVSHLRVYGPVEDKRLWQGKAQETGILTWEIDGRFIVAKVVAGSAAAAAGVQVGDQILLAGGQSPITRWQMQSASGAFEFDRRGEIIKVNLHPTEISIDQSPELIEVSPGVAALKISSYRSEYFENKKWKELSEKLFAYPKVIIDLRDNLGGNFVAMLRSLSPFICTDQDLGRLTQPRRSDQAVESFADNVNDLYQIEHIEKYKEVPLKRFDDYGCYKGKVVTLINRRTSSVAEIFAQAIKDHPKHILKGEPTSGDVVLAIWYGITKLGDGYTLSIPEAISETADGTPLEGRGVEPEFGSFYNLEDALKGEDSWLTRAFEASPKY